MYAYDEAEKNLRVAYSLLNSLEESQINIFVMEELADVCKIVRNFTDAIKLYRDALEKLESLSNTDPLIHLRLNRKIVEIATVG